MTDTPSEAATAPAPLSDGEGTGVDDSECGAAPSGRYGLQYEYR